MVAVASAICLLALLFPNLEINFTVAIRIQGDSYKCHQLSGRLLEVTIAIIVNALLCTLTKSRIDPGAE